MRPVRLIAAIAAVGCLLLPAVLSSCRSPALGLVDGNLVPCPDSPNCVSSLASDDAQRVEPFTFEGHAAEAMAALVSLVEAQPRTRVVTAEPTYVHTEFRTRWLRFVDDVEFQLDADARVIHVRSASRLGYSDLGANRRRVEALRAAWKAR